MLLGLQKEPYLLACLGERATLGRSLRAQLATSSPAETLPRSPGGICAPAPAQQTLAQWPSNQSDPSLILVLRRPTGCTV